MMPAHKIPEFSDTTPDEAALTPKSVVRLSDPVDFLSLTFNPMRVRRAAAYIDGWASQGLSFDYLATPNVDHMVRLHREPNLRPLYEEAGLLVNDSAILRKLAALDGKDMPSGTGADIVEALLDHHIDKDEPLVVIGCNEDDITAIRAKYGLTNLHWYDAPMGLRKNPEAVAKCAEFMAAHPSRFHFICVGSPQQEMVALAAKNHGGAVGIGLCVGATFDFLSGKTARAPKWMQRAGLEWFHRMCSEPKRLVRRYLIEGPAIFKIWWSYRGK